MFRELAAAALEFYTLPLKVFLAQEKEPLKYYSYESFRIRGFRGLSDVSLGFAKNDLILLLGLNESGKTSILRAIEAFDFSNDPKGVPLKPFFTSMRNKQDIDSSSPCIITANITFSQDLQASSFKRALDEAEVSASGRSEIDIFLKKINERRSVQISRMIPFQNGNPGKNYYQFEGEDLFSDEKIGRVLAQAIVSQCPFILYFEDFQDAIPERIYTRATSDAFNPSWYEIIDGLFYNTSPDFSIEKYESYFRPSNLREDDAGTVLNKVNKTLQRAFTEKWETLSGVKEIEKAEITYNQAKRYFEIKVLEKDGTRYSVHERSKGAIWYLAFLMKTEFRRKKLREGSGKPIYLIDEPASNLHSTAQQKMVGDFITLVEDTSLIYTTHSKYLISLSNIKNTYVVQRADGEVRCTRWSDYIKGKNAQTSYYQPLYDFLNIVPNNFDMPWENAIITEGPSDALTLELMEYVLNLEPTHAIYPGASASSLDTLISLNLGWGASFRIMLDSDKEGRKQSKRYMEELGVAADRFCFLPGEEREIEGMFTKTELSKLNHIAFGLSDAEVAKKDFLALMRALVSKLDKDGSKVRGAISADTKEAFQKLFAQLRSA